MARPTHELNEHAAGTLAQNMDMFQNGACRIFEHWANTCFQCRQSAPDEFGQPRYLAREEMLRSYRSLGEWSRAEQCIDDGRSLDIALFPFSGRKLPPIATRASVQARIADAAVYAQIHESGDPIPVWEDVLAYFYEALLQHILRVQDWTDDELDLWAGQRGCDLPDIRSVNRVMENITPEAALMEARVARFPAVPEIQRPRPRLNGHHFGLQSA